MEGPQTIIQNQNLHCPEEAIDPSSIRQFFVRVFQTVAMLALFCGCLGGRYYHSLYGTVGLVAHAVAFDALHKGDLGEARRVLEIKLAAAPQDPELNYTLGCVELMQSDDVTDHRQKHALQVRGWQRVELASGKFYPADQLLAHAYLVGRWGKHKNNDLYSKYLHLAHEGFSSTGGTAYETKLIKRTWVVISPP